MADPRIGTDPLYTNNLGQPVYWIEGAPHGSRTENMSERTKVPYTQGFGSIGGLRPAMNTHCISIEVEGPGPITPANPLGFSPDLLSTAAGLAASILADWHNTRARSLLVVGHDHLDRYDRKGRHTDPHFDWTRMLQMIYTRLPALTGNVKGWGR
jgi:hypothetical protein